MANLKKKLLLIAFLIFLFWLLRPLFSRGISGWQFVTEARIISHPVFDQENLYFGNEAGYVYALNKKTGREIWRFRANDGVRDQVAVGSDSLYLVAFDSRVYALDKKTGQEIWRFVIPDLSYPDTAPVISGDFLFLGTRSEVLYALDRMTGEEIWRFDTSGVDFKQTILPKSPFKQGWFIVDEKNIYLNKNSRKTFLVIDKVSGKERWRFDSFVSPLKRVLIGEGLVVFKDARSRIYAFDKEDGDLKWQFQFDESGVDGSRMVLKNNLFYHLSSEGRLLVLEAQTGKQRWEYQTAGKPDTKKVLVNESKVYFTEVNMAQEGALLVLNSETGEEVWRFDSKEPIAFHSAVDRGTVYVVSGDLYALKSEDGGKIWQTGFVGQAKHVLVSKERVYLLLTDILEKMASVWLIDRQSGERKWAFDSGQFDLETPKENEGDFYILAEDGRAVVALLKEGGDKFLKRVVPKQPRAFFPFEKRDIEVVAKREVEKNEVDEMTIKHRAEGIKDPWKNVKVKAIFKNESGQTWEVKGFYYAENVWRLRFRPPLAGEWTWELTFRTPAMRRIKKGKLTVRQSQRQGFLETDAADSYRFVLGDKLFSPLGIQTCLKDLDYDGNPLNQLFLGVSKSPRQGKTEKTVDLEAYLRAYGSRGAGFNIFRWSVDNCSFKLWQEISPSGNRYFLREGFWGDHLVRKLEDEGFRIWMTVFGFEPPFSDSIDKKNHQVAIKNYLDYVVARYGAYVDIWELSNEALVSQEWIEFCASYLREIDPYNHPLAVSWERPDLPEVQVSSPHWYESGEVLFSDARMANKIKGAQKWGKPVVFSEVGNADHNWDRDSALRMRARAWASFFEGAGLIFWDTSKNLFQNKSGNLYLGPIEKGYVRALADFKEGLGAGWRKEKISLVGQGVRGYALASKEAFLAYFYHFENHDRSEIASFEIIFQKPGFLQWINPQTGKVIKEAKIQAGKQFLETPPFRIDLALKISFKNDKEKDEGH
jgi:outer membrane protein assembly factor BamB